MKKNNWWNRYFHKETLEKEQRKYRKLKKLLSVYPQYFDDIVNSKSLLQLVDLHKQIWKAGFRNVNLGPCEWGMFRCEDINTMDPSNVYVGNIFGLFTHSIPEWEKFRDEIMGPNGFGIPRDTKIYDLLLDHYKCVLKSNMNAIRSAALEYTSEYESINNDKDSYEL